MDPLSGHVLPTHRAASGLNGVRWARKLRVVGQLHAWSMAVTWPLARASLYTVACVGSVATNSWHGTTTFGTGAQLWEIPPVRGGFVPRGKANGQATPPTGNNYGILPPARADRPVPNVADLPNVGSNASYQVPLSTII